MTQPSSLPQQAPPLVSRLAKRVAQAGGRTFAVGGIVRDHLLGRPFFDWDIEVHAVEEPDLVELLKELGTVDMVGRAFSVFKLTRGRLTLDVSLPRRDSNAGPGHRGIAVVGQPHLGTREAARRRDLTVNAMLCDLLTGEIVDPFNGLADLKAGVLREVDPVTFVEDPLRALRVVQFAARLHFEPHNSLVALCRSADVHELVPERVRTEWFKLLLSDKPGFGMRVARDCQLIERVFPELDTLCDDAVFERLIQARGSADSQGEAIALMLTAWLAHSTADAIVATFDRLGLHKWLGYPVRDTVCQAVAALDQPHSTDADLRHLATRATPWVVLQALAALDPDSGAATSFLRAQSLGVDRGAEAPLLLGRDLLQLGLPPGPRLGVLLSTLYREQLNGLLRTRETSLQRARQLIDSPNDESR